ncbi:MAG: hypothetical protein ABR551_06480 [Gemmatimonadales bacterium]
MIAPVLDYARWQLRDHVRGAGLVIVLFTAVLGLILWQVAKGNPGLADGAVVVLATTLSQLAWPLVVLAVAGMVSTDRVDGYNRSLFSAPVTPAWYYLQRFLIGGVILATLPIMIAVAIRLSLGAWVAPWEAVRGVVLLYLLLGGLVFCWSTFGRRDWAIGVSLYLGQSALHGAREAGMPLPGFLRDVTPLLPPFHLVEFGGMEGREILGTTLPTGWDLVHYLGYAAGLLGIGVAVLLFRPMGSGGKG